MLSKLRRASLSEVAITVVEVGVVVLIVAMLVAIAVPAFIGEHSKSQDRAAEAAARNLASHVESCYGIRQTYKACNAPAKLASAGSEAGDVKLGSGAGEARIRSTSNDGYEVVAVSRTGDRFSIARVPGSGITRTCTNSGRGDCPTGGHW